MKPAANRRKFSMPWRLVKPTVKRVQRDLPPHFERVRAATTVVEGAMQQIEERFLNVSTTLDTTTNLGRDLVEHCEALISLALGQGGGEIMIDAAAQHIWQAIEFVERGDQRMAQLIEQLAASNEQISQTLAMEQILSRTIAPLNYIQTLFRVESAGLPADVQDMFHALVREMERIRQRVEGGFREKFALIREIQSILTRAIAELIAEQARAQQSVAGLRQHMTTSLADMKGSYEKNRDRDTRLIDVSRAVNAETGKVVMALQFQDIINQKFQNTRAVLTEMESTFARAPADRVAACSALRFIQQSGVVAGAQLGAMKAELLKAGQEIGGGLRQIIHHMESLDGNCLALRDLDTVTTGVDGAVQILLDSLSDVRRLVTAAGAHATKAHKTIEPIGGMTTNFTSFMRELSLEIQLIGLNAEVQATHVGRGTGLEVLSANTSAISRDTSRLSETLAQQLDALTSGLDRVVVVFREIRDENQAYCTTLDTDIASDEECLHDYRNSALKVLLHLSEQLPKLEANTKSASEQSDFSTAVAGQIAELQTALLGLTTAAQAAADALGVEVETEGLTDRFIGNYTMRSQVDVHRDALGQAAPPADSDAAPAPTGTVELFGSEEPATTAPSPVAGELEMFGADSPPPASPPATMGNIEMFAGDGPPAASAPAGSAAPELWLEASAPPGSDPGHKLAS